MAGPADINTLRVCFFGVYDPAYPRNAVMLRGLREQGVVITECREESGGVVGYMRLVRALRKAARSCDVVIVPFPYPTASILARMFIHKPVVVDAFFSAYDAVVRDRKECAWYHPRALRLLFLDWVSLYAASAVLVDTEAHAAFWRSWRGLARKNTCVLPIGADPADFAVPAGRPPTPVTVTFHGTFIPLQGVEKIVEACALLRDRQDITWRFIGDGQTYPAVIALARKRGVAERIEFIRRVPYDYIPGYLAASEMVLGIFGDTEKAQRVVPNKVYEGLAAGKAVITMDTSAIREFFSDTELALVSGTADSIAGAVTKLHDDPALRLRIAEAGSRRFTRDYTPRPVGARLAVFLGSLI